jgi:hypothetical protein
MTFALNIYVFVCLKKQQNQIEMIKNWSFPSNIILKQKDNHVYGDYLCHYFMELNLKKKTYMQILQFLC